MGNDRDGDDHRHKDRPDARADQFDAAIDVHALDRGVELEPLENVDEGSAYGPVCGYCGRYS
jgi:hypothetical protein